ncbi:hypothetical protein Q9233_013115 [Columba guinea]|nr:hypothetical protein Q9233_013115 [Columba guinea]
MGRTSVGAVLKHEKAVAAMVPGNLDDFSLEDAINDFNLEHALHPDDPKPDPPSNPRDTDNPKQGPPAHPKDTGNFDDSDLAGSLPKGGGDGSGSNERKGPSPNEETEASQGAIAGIVSAVVATVIGAVSSFIAYQKKKLCFKQSADEENVNMDSHRGAQSEPPVLQYALLMCFSNLTKFYRKMAFHLKSHYEFGY